MTRRQIPRFKEKPYKSRAEFAPVAGALPFVVIGAGPVGLTLALDLARKGRRVVVVAALDFVPAGSKAICISKQTLDIFDRLGVGERVAAKGVVWNIGKVFWKDRKDPIFQFDLLPVKDQKNPAFVNIQQYYVEDYLIDALEAMENVEIRWGHAVVDITAGEGGARLRIATRDCDYDLDADYVLACDGHRSTIRELMRLDFEGRVFEDNFLIADIRFAGDGARERPSERWFWFDPPFCAGGTSLLHKQPDDVWRCDFQLGWNIDRIAALKSENVAPLVRGLLGETVEFEEVWNSVYTFQCRRMARFVHGRVIFVGDSAHLVSPFGARGANGGIADAENIAWKLDFVLNGKADARLIESYNDERVAGADENILNSSRSTDFMSPKGAGARALRDAVLELSGIHDFARPFINSGRLSRATPYCESPLSTPDRDDWKAGPPPGHPCVDAPMNLGGYLLSELGDEFKLLRFGDVCADTNLPCVEAPLDGLAAERYGASNGAAYLVRPDQVVAARWRKPRPDEIASALKRVTAR